MSYLPSRIFLLKSNIIVKKSKPFIRFNKLDWVICILVIKVIIITEETYYLILCHTLTYMHAWTQDIKADNIRKGNKIKHNPPITTDFLKFIFLNIPYNKKWYKITAMKTYHKLKDEIRIRWTIPILLWKY